jgi:hypothetical protein
MALLPDVYKDPTLAEVDRIIEAEAAAEPPRRYLGASSLGDKCERKLWYQFNGYPASPRRAALIYAAQDGHRCEAVLAERLRKVPGVELWTADEQGNQYGFSDFDRRFGGHIDGMIRGILQAPKTLHVWESKSLNEKRFAEFRRMLDRFGGKQCLVNFDFKWYTQAQLYMGYFDAARHYLTACYAGARDVLSCRTEFDRAFFGASRAKALRIIEAKEPPARIASDPSFYYCKWCEFRGTCYGPSPAGAAT